MMALIYLWMRNPYVASSVWAAALEDDGTDIPVDEEPLEAEGVAVPAADARGAAAGTGEGDVVEVRDGTLRAARGHGARVDLMEARQEEPPVPRAVYERVAHVTHRRADDGEAEQTAVILKLGGRLEKLARALIPQRSGHALHVLHLEAHVTHGVHRIVRVGSEQTLRVPVLTWLMSIQPPLVDHEHGGSPAERELLRSVRQSGREHVKLEPGHELVSDFFHVWDVERNMVQPAQVGRHVGMTSQRGACHDDHISVYVFLWLIIIYINVDIFKFISHIFLKS